MKKYEKPSMDVIELNNAVIVTSCDQPCSELEDDELPIIF